MRCVIICGSPDYDIELIKSVIKSEDYVICADRGYAYAKMADIEPNLIVGDFDSYTGEVSGECEIIRLNTHKDDTDTMHAIDIAVERGCTDFVLLSALGGRFDHSFANVSALEYIKRKKCNGMILTSSEKILFLSLGKHIINNCKGRTFSLFPFGCEKVCVTYANTEYPAQDLELESDYPMGVSNVFTNDNAIVQISRGKAIMIINL